MAPCCSVMQHTYDDTPRDVSEAANGRAPLVLALQVAAGVCVLRRPRRVLAVERLDSLLQLRRLLHVLHDLLQVVLKAPDRARARVTAARQVRPA